jgi:hypothetical protein
MSLDETDRILRLIQKAIKEKRSKDEIVKTFRNAGIITEKGNLRSPYKEIYIPVKK